MQKLRNKGKIVVMVAVLMLIQCLFILPKSAFAQEETTTGTQTEQSKSKDILLIQTRLPWGENSNDIVLKSLNVTYDIITAEQALETDLSNYRVVSIANEQTTTFYKTIELLKPSLETFVLNGGTVIYGICHNDSLPNSTILGGVQVSTYQTKNNIVVDATHPIVTAKNSDQVALVDADLVGNFCSHNVFSSLPSDAKTILSTPDGKPTLVEYKMGKGTVIANGLTFECAYKHNWAFAIKAMDDLYLYSLNVIAPVDVTPGTVTSVVTTKVVQYNVGEDMAIHIQNKLSNYKRDAFAKVSICDMNNKVLEVLDTTVSKSLTADVPLDMDYVWKVKSFTPGSYKVVIQWYTGDDYVGGGETTFVVQTNQCLTNTLTLASKELTVNDSQVIYNTIQNQSKNDKAANVTAKVTVEDATGKVVKAYDYIIPEIAFGGSYYVKEAFALDEFNIGIYTVTTKIYQANVLMNSSKESFVVKDFNVNVAKLSGTIGTVLEENQNILTCNYTVTNHGKKATNTIPVYVKLVDKATLGVVNQFNFSVIIAPGATVTAQNKVDVSKLEVKGYRVDLYVIDDAGKEVVLATTDFTITDRTPVYFKAGYSLFASENSVWLGGYKFIIDGSIYSKDTLSFNGSILDVNNSCVSSKNIQANGWMITMDKKEEYAAVCAQPNYTETLLNNLRNDGTKVSELNYSEYAVVDKPIICDSTTNAYVPKIQFNASLVSKNAVNLNADSVTLGEKNAAILCSLDGNITINATNVTGNGIIYAPNGTVEINACNVNFHGSIIAKNIKINCTECHMDTNVTYAK